MELQYHIGGSADFHALDQTVQRVNQMQGAQEQHNAALAAQAGRAKTVLDLKQKEANLIAQANALTQSGNHAEAARTLQLAQQLKIQQGITAQQQQQASAAAAGGGWFSPAGRSFGGKLAGDFEKIGEQVVSPIVKIASLYSAFETAKSLVFGSLEKAKEVHAGSRQLNTTTDEYQQLSKAAGKEGMDVDAFYSAIYRLGAAREAAANGDEKLIDNFSRLGIEMEKLQDPALRTIDLLRMIGKVSGTLNSADRTALRGMLGRGGERIAMATANFAEADPAAKKIHEENIEALVDFERGWKKFWSAAKTDAANFFGEFLLGQRELIAKARELIGLPEARKVTKEEDAAIAYATESNQNRWRREQGLEERPLSGPAAEYATYLRERDRLNQRADEQQRIASSGGNIADKQVKYEQARRRFLELEEKRKSTPQNQFSAQDGADWVAARKAMQEAQQEVERAPEIARKAGALAQDLRQRAGGSMREVLDAPDGPLFGDGIKAKQQANKLAREELEFQLMSATEKRAKLEREIADLKDRQAKTTDEMTKATLEGQQIGLEAKLAALGKGDAATDSRLAVSATALQRIGIFTGGPGGVDPVQTRLDAIAAAASGNWAAARALNEQVRQGLAVKFQ